MNREFERLCTDVADYLVDYAEFLPGVVDVTAVAADIYASGIRNIECVRSVAFFASARRHTLPAGDDAADVPNPPYDMPIGINAWSEL